MALKNNILKNNSGGVIILVALIMPLLLTVVGVAIDLGRLYAVRSRAQTALDAAIIGGAATASSINVQTEARNLFAANYITGYMGTTVTGPNVLTSGSAHTATAQVRVPWAVMQIFGFTPVTLTLTSRVTTSSVGQQLELAMVIDNSSVMPVTTIRTPTSNFVSNLFAGASLPNTFVSVLPFNSGVNIGIAPATRINWAQNTAAYTLLGAANRAYLAGRNPDIPPDTNYSDISDTPPGVAMTTRFRTPYGLSPGTFNNGDFISGTLQLVLFGENVRNPILTRLNAMTAGGRTRINVGLMWGWFALSPRWQGRWDPAKPTLPQAFSQARQKNLLLVVGSRNNVYLGGTQTCGAGVCAVSNDNTTTAALCSAIKGQGIYIYTVGYGPSANYDGAQLQACSSGQGYFYTAVNTTELTNAYNQIRDHMKYNTLRLQQ
ncbi:MAG: hypothetical protein EBV03_06610 [Proteobacteria bacterium]|nr:hypothetical protein [Pseudomonadota bacterium]